MLFICVFSLNLSNTVFSHNVEGRVEGGVGLDFVRDPVHRIVHHRHIPLGAVQQDCRVNRGSLSKSW